MGKVLFTSSVLAATAAIVLSGSMAYAGGAAGSAGLRNQHFKCYLITAGDSAGRSVVDLTDQFTPVDESGLPIPDKIDRVRVGRPRMLCTPVEKTVVKCPDGTDPILVDDDGDLNTPPTPTCAPPRAIREDEIPDHYTCYEIHHLQTDDPRARVTLTNQFAVDSVTVRHSTLLCAPTIKCNPATPCPPISEP